MIITVAVSGGFDPLHIGHVRYLEAAKNYGEKLIVILNGDSFLDRKKGFCFMPAKERIEILKALRCVDEVYLYNSDKDDVIGALEVIRPNIFAKGGDRTGRNNIPEWDFCKEKGIQIITNIGGIKIQSSQWLTKNIEEFKC
jgi:D-beta-D-heptose 7-phosphate kinase/D-beta-D-heptose 1-phosphate adenosyltransferase